MTAPTETVIDVPSLGHGRCRSVIQQTLMGLGLNETVLLVNDHDPWPLRDHLALACPGKFGFDYLREGPDVWHVRIHRLA